MKFELNPGFRCLAACQATVAAGTRGGSLIAWDPKTGRECGAWNLGGSPVMSLLPRPDGGWMAADQEGILWTATSTGAERSLSWIIHAMALSADRKRLLTVGREALLRDAATLEPVARGPALSGRVRSVAANPIGTAFALADRSLALWRPEEGDVERRDISCAFVDFIDHAHLVVAEGDWADVYDIRTWTRTASMRSADGEITCAWLDRASATLYVGTHRGRVVPFTLRAGRVESPLALASTAVIALAPFSDGLAAAQDRSVSVLARAPLRLSRTLERHAADAPELIEFLPEQGRMASMDERSIRLWDQERGVQVGGISQQEPWDAMATALSPDGSLLALASSHRQDVRLIRLDTGEESGIPTPASVSQVRFAASGRTLGLLTAFDTIALVPLQEKKLNILPGRHRAFAFGPSGLLAAVSLDNTLRLFDAAGRNVLFTQRQEGEVARVQFSCDASHLGVLDYSGHVRVIALDTGHESSRALSPAPAEKTRFALGEGGSLLAIGTVWGVVQLWYEGQKLAEFTLDRELRQLSIHEGRLWCAAVDPDRSEGPPTRFAEAASFPVTYDALFTFRLSPSR